MYDPGNLRERVLIVDPFALEENDLGELVEGRKEVGWAWAKVVPVRGKEFLEAKKVQVEASYTIYIRYRPDISEDMILEWRNHELKIDAIFDIDSRREYLEIRAHREEGHRGS